MATPELVPRSACWSRLLQSSSIKGGTRPSRKVRLALLWACSLLLLSAGSATAVAQEAPDSSVASESAAAENPGTPVEIDGRPILSVYASVAGISPQERAAAIQKRVVELGRRRDLALESIHVEDHGSWSEILAGKDRIMGITPSDAAAADRARPELAAEYAEIIRIVVKQYREEHTWRHFVEGLVYTFLATVALVTLLVAAFMIRRRAGGAIEQRLARREAERPKEVLVPQIRRYLGPPFTAMFHTLFWVAILGMLQTYVTVILRFFAATRYTSYQITHWLLSGLGQFGKAIVAYIPHLMLVGLICLLTAYVIRVNRFIFEEIRDERLAIRGFYPDWAEPTAKLVRFLILAAAAIVVFPYLPGSDSPAFKGISVFLGVLLSLGSTSAVAHAVAGTILTYMRAFQVGDFVRIGNDIGEVVEKTLLVTRICTQKKEVVTIPNGTVLGGVVINYSAEARQKGVIFHTTVTIGYNAPWRQVHELLISAASATDDVMREPAPFVVQTALNDFYVAYELNAYTIHPKNMQNIYSALHQNIQDKFNEAGVEINSPHYAALRDGNRTTIPNHYLPSDYKTPVFKTEAVKESAALEPVVDSPNAK